MPAAKMAQGYAGGTYAQYAPQPMPGDVNRDKYAGREDQQRETGRGRAGFDILDRRRYGELFKRAPHAERRAICRPRMRCGSRS